MGNKKILVELEDGLEEHEVAAIINPIRQMIGVKYAKIIKNIDIRIELESN